MNNTLERLSYVPDGSNFHQSLERTTHLAIGAHQDDLEIFAYHGISACFESKDQWFGGVTVTDGGGSSRNGVYSSYSDQQMKEIRHHEQNRAADLGKYSFQSQLRYPSSVLKNRTDSDSLVQMLGDLLVGCRPETLYLHSPLDKHPTHLAVLWHCIEALRQLDSQRVPTNIYGCEVWRDLDWMRDDLKIGLPVDKYPELARELIEAFDSQVSGGKDYVKATLGRRHANATFFNSHAVDACSAITYAIDLQPLVNDPGKSIQSFALEQIDRFRSEVKKTCDELSV